MSEKTSYLMISAQAGQFLSHRAVVGVSADELLDMLAGRCRQTRLDQINRSLIEQFESLRDAEAAGRC